ncbi:MAG TPA: homocysteine S-methyltransferase family protein, partial [Casimicrobiaceae bacterium]|nr:homocysteine S-methyltransferase family protein [Casimicrobiaceae bacterium]
MQPDRSGELVRLLRERILILDGAWGTMIQERKLSESDFRGPASCGLHDHAGDLKGNNDILVLTRPDVVRDIHDAYFAAGADITETNTFSSTRIAQADYGLENRVREMNRAAAQIARECADRWTAKQPAKPRFVAGSLGPTNRTASISPDVTNPAYRAVDFDQLAAAYREQAEALLDGGVDLLQIE